MAQAIDRAGKPINTNDGATVVGSVTSVSGSGPTASVVILLAGSGTSVTVQAQDIGATTQTL
jgi:hypothetical protein